MRSFFNVDLFFFRKLFTFIGQFGPCLGLVGLSLVGCNQSAAIAVLTISVAFSGCVYSGFLVGLPHTRRYNPRMEFSILDFNVKI